MKEKKVSSNNLIRKMTLFIILFFVFFATIPATFCKTIKKEVEITTKDSRIIKATLTYPKIDGVQKYPTIVLLHSIGYSSVDWGNLIPILNEAGYAVLAVDLRGHGKSIYNSNLQQRTWTYFTNKTYQKFPSDVVEILKQAQAQNKKISLDNMAIVGADIGANTAVLAVKKLPKKPKALVLISATSSFKGLYIPITLTEIGCIPILAMASKQDSYSIKEEETIAKFAQGSYFVKNYSKGGMGMMMLKVNPTMPYDITKWLMRYL